MSDELRGVNVVARAADVLETTRHLLEMGICRGVMAQGLDGETLLPNDPCAVKYCTTGAMYAAAFDENVAVMWLAARAVMWAITGEVEEKPFPKLWKWHDDAHDDVIIAAIKEGEDLLRTRGRRDDLIEQMFLAHAKQTRLYSDASADA